MVGQELSRLLERDIHRVIAQVRAFPEERLIWETLPGVSNSAGNLVLHLIGNLSEYIGRQIGGIAFTRQRPREFADKGASSFELIRNLEAVASMASQVVANLQADALAAKYPEAVLGYEMTTIHFLIHLIGHLNYHLGQIDYLRRILTGNGAIQLPSVSSLSD